MNILAVDTSTGVCSAAILDDEECQRGLHDNTLVRDERLKVALSKLPNHAPQHD